MNRNRWGKNLAFDDGEVDLDLIEPAGVNWRVNDDQVGPSLPQPFLTRETAMRGTVVDNPEDSVGRTIGSLGHDLVDETVEWRDSGFLFASP